MNVSPLLEVISEHMILFLTETSFLLKGKVVGHIWVWGAEEELGEVGGGTIIRICIRKKLFSLK